MKWVIAVGDLGSGFMFIGPFDDYAAADDWNRGHREQGGHIRVVVPPATVNLPLAVHDALKAAVDKCVQALTGPVAGGGQ